MWWWASGYVVVAYRILVSAPVPFCVYWGWNWFGLGWDWVWGDWGIRGWGLGLDNFEVKLNFSPFRSKLRIEEFLDGVWKVTEFIERDAMIHIDESWKFTLFTERSIYWVLVWNIERKNLCWLPTILFACLFCHQRTQKNKNRDSLKDDFLTFRKSSF